MNSPVVTAGGARTSQPLAAAVAPHAVEPGQAETWLAAQADAAPHGIRPGAPAAEAGAAASALSATEPHELGVCDLLKAYGAGLTTPAAVVAHLVARIEAGQNAPQAVLRLVEGAREAAAESSRRWRDGAARPLEGLPFGVKDIIDVGGARVTCGSLHMGDRLAPRDATVVERLRAAGAIPLAMLATSEFAAGWAHNARFGAVPNPWDASRWTGGSSTGSGAALAARLVPLALGTDTGGSIRIPSAWCGTTGLKPTRGLVPRSGVAILSWTLDHIGPMARSTRDLAAVLPVIAGPDGKDPLAASALPAGSPAPAPIDLAALRIGVPDRWFDRLCDKAVIEAWRAALATLEAAGARLIDVDLGGLGDIATIHEDGWTILLAELAATQEIHHARSDLFDPSLRDRIAQGRDTTALDYIRALRRRPLAQRAFAAAMAGVDLLITPGLGAEAAFLSDLTVEVDGSRLPIQQVHSRNTMIFDYLGLPALMLPAGRGACGLPVAVQIVGRPFADGLCLGLGSALQERSDHHRARPGA